MKVFDEIIFFNPYHNGDIHLSREFVKDIIKKIKNKKYYYEHHNCWSLTADIVDLEFREPSFFGLSQNENIIYLYNKCYINTWVATNNYRYHKEGGGCKLSSLYNKFSDIYKHLQIDIDKPSSYIPDIDFTKIKNIDHINDYFLNTCKENNIFISNGDVRSQQAHNFNFNEIVVRLSKKNKNKFFFLTKKNDFLLKNVDKNVIFTEDLSILNHSDLLQNAYISTKCNYIIGRSSGPYEFSKIKDNLLDQNKTYICFNKNKVEGEWKEEYIFCKSFNYEEQEIEKIYLIIDQHINREKNEYNISL